MGQHRQAIQLIVTIDPIGHTYRKDPEPRSGIVGGA